ncbi:zinc-finger double domain-containing protein [Phthorimaea operculella]|nr:zinc-finger double domain-containing protein [Phthorimaea operculella]
MFSTERMLRRHDKINHIAAICKLCFVQFPSKMALRVHLDKHDLFKCEQCKKTYINRHTYKLHLKICGRSDTRIPKFFCDMCNKGFARKNSLRTHLKVNHGYGNVVTCNWCKKKFDAVSKLKMHIVKHTRERNFCCSQCGGKFVTQAALVYHTRLHTGEKPFPCDMCDESFLSASRRMEHKRRKHLEPTKQCPYCQVKFVTSHELKKHVARHTNPQSKLYVPLEPYNKTLPSVDDAYVLKFLS